MTPQLQSLIQMKQWCSSLARAHTEVKQCASKKNVSEVGQSVCGGSWGKKSLLVRLMEGKKNNKKRQLCLQDQICGTAETVTPNWALLTLQIWLNGSLRLV